MTSKTPTNIITGFLGTGKTTAILNLLKDKPENERWAVLVNEFGEIGIDGALMTEHGAMIKEVPGGCMCCTAGVPMSVGINALLRQNPDRLLIEPTGLGHPGKVMSVLLSEQYAPYVDLKATIALMDARNLSVERYAENQNFIDQLACADIIIANKADTYSEQDRFEFDVWLAQQEPVKLASEMVTQAQFSHELLNVERTTTTPSQHIAAHHHEHAVLEPQFKLPPNEAFIRKENRGQGHFSCGWLFGSEYLFNFDQLFSMLSALTAERVKAVMNTDKGCYAFNIANGMVSVNEMSLDGFESRLEVIDSQLMPWQELETILLSMCGLNVK